MKIFLTFMFFFVRMLLNHADEIQKLALTAFYIYLEMKNHSSGKKSGNSNIH